mmetsp:Transcript_1728/g.3692  ORF Transcript_1728/g.3692 Transcript_1728/m.3692 type:complete len:458 (-) Transcript_1728:90-1463(-)
MNSAKQDNQPPTISPVRRSPSQQHGEQNRAQAPPEQPAENIAQDQPASSHWFVTELLKRTDLSSGDIYMFHYPKDFFPRIDVGDMGRAFEMILQGQLGQQHQLNIRRLDGTSNTRDQDALAAGQDANSSEQLEEQELQQDNSVAPVLMSNATLEARNQIIRIQFSWYQFAEFPREALGRTYSNLQHVDVRQNASLTCIDSLISQLPHLTSLNLSDCPNIRTLAPLASALSIVEDGNTDDLNLEEFAGNRFRHTLNLRHLWVRGCNLSFMSKEEWANVFDALAESSGPLERLTLSRNSMSYLHGNIGKLKRLNYLFVEDNHAGGGTKNGTNISNGFEIPDELGNLSSLRFVSFCGNNVTSLPRTMGRLNDNCDVYLHRNLNLIYPPQMYQRSVKTMRRFFHEERMALLRGAVMFMPHCKRARWRANERLYRPGGWGYVVCKERFEESARRTSISLVGD